MMDLSQSLVDATAMIFHRFEGVVRDRGNYLCITTPGNPTFYWGNYLLFARRQSRVCWRIGKRFSLLT